MLGKAKAQQICQKILTDSEPDQAEVILFQENNALTRFANNTIHQNVSENNLNLIVRLMVGSRAGMATTNHLDNVSLNAVISRARENAQASPENPDYPGLAGPGIYARVDSHDRDTANYTPEGRAREVGVVCRLASESGLNASGAFSTGVGEITVANSNGVFAHYASTQADFQTVVMSDDSSGRAQTSAWRAGDIPIEDLGREAIHKTEAGRSPQEAEPGEYTVVLDPYSVQDLVNMLNFHGMGAQSVLEGRSWMNDRIGERAMSDMVTIWDDGLDLAGSPLPFDFEGTPKQRVDIVKDGVIGSPVYDRLTAQKAGTSSTGHALPPTFRSFGPLATNLFIAPGDTSTADMIHSTSSGLYITRFWYTRLVHPSDCVITGMTRDGVFKIENGRIAHPVKNLRFTQSYVQALAGVETVGAETRLLLSPYGNLVSNVPALKIKHFNFTGSTV